MVMEQVCKVRWGHVVKCFICEEDDFELDAVSDGEPVEITEDGGDVVSGAGVGEQACG